MSSLWSCEQKGIGKSQGLGKGQGQGQGLFFVEKAIGGVRNNFNGTYTFRDDIQIHTKNANHGDPDPDSDPRLTIIGIKNIVDKEVPLKRKALWIISLLVCCSLVAYYVSSRVAYILSRPTQVAVTLKQNDSLQLPDVTLCPNTPFIPAKLTEYGMTPDGLPSSTFQQTEGFNVTQLWVDLSPTIKLISGSSVNYVNTMGSWDQMFTTMGLCFRHRYDDDVKASGLSFGMSVRVNWSLVGHSKALSDLEGLKVFFHERRDSPLTEVDGINVTPGEDLSVAIRIKAFKSLHRAEHPCVQNADYARSQCVNQCFNKELFLLTKCSLPFMTSASAVTSPGGETVGVNVGVGNSKSNSNSSEFQSQSQSQTPCSPAELYTSAFRTFWKKSKRNLTLWAECGRSCMIECSKLIYTPYIESVAVSNAEHDVGKFTIYFPEMWYEIVEQKESYDVIAFLCDIGGTFGLFLGCSLLTLVELVEIIVSFVAQKYFHMNSRTSAT